MARDRVAKSKKARKKLVNHAYPCKTAGYQNKLLGAVAKRGRTLRRKSPRDRIGNYAILLSDSSPPDAIPLSIVL